MEEYNRPFSLDELRKSLHKAHDTACGPDDIHYQLLKHLPESALQVLLDLMNDIWETGDLPSIWKLANVSFLFQNLIKTIPNRRIIGLLH